MKKWILIVIPIFVFAGAAGAIPDPSAVYCVLQGYGYEIRTDEYGNQYGVCVFPDGSECSTWDYYCKCEPNGITCRPGFSNCHWPCKEMRCKEAGESVLVSKCCEGLNEIYPTHIFDANCNKLELVGWLFLCSDCGNGICEDWESRCNCPADCAQPRIIYVDDDASGANDGSSWADAFNYLQDALRAAWPGDEVRIAQGIYKPDQGDGIMLGDREATFQLINSVVIKGGYAGFGEPNPDDRNITAYETILSGDLDGNDIDVNDLSDLWDEPSRAENSYHVVNGSNTDSNSILDGFTITGGNANGVSYICAGGGMYNDSGSPTLTNCLFVNNSADTGGGLCNRFSKNLILLNCTFRRNQARTWAGGVYNLDSNLCLNNCIFIENLSGFCGGGVDSLYGSLKLFNCKFSGNAADFSGGGIHWDDPFDVIIMNCLFVGNSSKYGGAISGEIGAGYPAIIKNCTFSCNSAEGKGGGLHIFLPPAPCVSPQSIKYDWGCYISNCILWGDIPDEIYDTHPVITYSDVEGGWPGEGNIDADPCFVQLGYWESKPPPEPPQPPIPPPPPPPPGSPSPPPPPNNEYYTWVEGDYHLLAESPCIDAGDPNYAAGPNETDLDGRPRIIGGRIDMGAYEYSLPITAEIRIVPRTINLQSKGKWIAAFIRLPEDYNVADINPDSVFLESEIQAQSLYIEEQKQVAIAKFRREELRGILGIGDAELTITGRLIDERVFEGKDIIRIIDKGGRKKAR